MDLMPRILTADTSQSSRLKTVSEHTVRRRAGGGEDPCSDDCSGDVAETPRSSVTWTGRGPAADIIDLDRYVRGIRHFSPYLASSGRLCRPECEQLVVDAGGLKQPGDDVSSISKPRSSTTSAGKQYSHDSGMSDGSYVRRHHHRQRRVTRIADNTTVRGYRASERGRDSSTSMRSFRVACTHALREQQEQITRVAQMCEKLTLCPATVTRRGKKCGRNLSTSTQDSSDLSSSSCSYGTRNHRRKDRNRAEECNTYKIIMSKLDELNRMFAARSESPTCKSCRMTRRRRVHSPDAHSLRSGYSRSLCMPSSGSVSVSDQFVPTSTPPSSRIPPRCFNRLPHTVKVVNRTSISNASRLQENRRSPRRVAEWYGDVNPNSQLSRLTETRAHSLDIPPVAMQRQPPTRMKKLLRRLPRMKVSPRRSGRFNVAYDRKTTAESIDESLLSGDSPRYQFDDVNQGKKTDRLHSVCEPPRNDGMEHTAGGVKLASLDGETLHAERIPSHTHGSNLCSLCRGYWRTISTLATHMLDLVNGQTN